MKYFFAAIIGLILDPILISILAIVLIPGLIFLIYVYIKEINIKRRKVEENLAKLRM
jgi:hypothetical protein